MEEDDPIDPDPPIESREEGIDGVWVGHIDAGPPGMGRIETEPDRVVPDAAIDESVGDRRELIHGRAKATTTAGGVFEDQSSRPDPGLDRLLAS